MRRFLPSVFLLLCCLSSHITFAQSRPISLAGDIPTLELPALDNAVLLERELNARKPDRAPAFAEVRPVDVRPSTHGNWTDNADGNSVWQLRVVSPTAHSLNLGFTEFRMPTGGELYLTTGRKDNWQTQGPYTPADNEVHNQLWTPMLNGDQLVINVTVPTAERENLRLWLTQVNHDFLDFDRQVKSGSCNVDVVCGAADGFPIVDLYRDIIRSVAVISTGGGTFCTGFLVNNTLNDGTPYFMTANHCGINAGNAPSLVTYWNFENSTCRAPGSGASGGNGDGALTTNNTGAIWRASNPASDMTIVELDDPVNPNANAFFAGWDNSYNVPTDTVIAVHHPSTDEKRISFTFQQTFFTQGFNGPNNPTGTHLEIPDWDIGTTEPGSSGSPVFDRFHRLRGQLHGGSAACGNDAYDTYGAVAASWEGGGSPSSRLRDWLDPNNSGVTFIDGRDVNAPQANISVGTLEQSVCGTDGSDYEVFVGGGFGGPVTLNVEDLPAGLNASYSQNPVTPGSTSVLTVTPSSGTNGTFTFTVSATNGADTDEALLRLTVTSAAPAAVVTVSPANFATDVSLSPVLTWGQITGASYEYEIATDMNFTDVVRTGTTDGAAFEPIALLEEDTDYYWRIRAENMCGQGPWSTTKMFTTLSIICRAGVASTETPLSIPDEGNGELITSLTLPANEPLQGMEVSVEIDHTYIGDLTIVLTSPDGISVTLVDRIGAAGGGFGCSGDDLDLVLTDQADNPYAALEATCNATGTAAAGTFQPIQPLSAFNGVAPGGEWTLTVTDNAGFDTGVLVNWAIVPCGTMMTLPVNLRAFAATADDCAAEIKWSAELEENFRHYALEQSTDGRRFTTVAEVLPNASGDYRYRVEEAPGTRFFRLRMVDTDGSEAYSAVVTTTNDCGKTGIAALYPNPTAGGEQLTVQFDRPLAAATTLDVFGADGRRVLTRSAAAGAAVHQLTVSALPAGTYYLRVVSGGTVITERFVVGK